MAEAKPVYVVQHNHFDPIWRRCWDRTFDYRGDRYRSYADLEQIVINLWLENARRGATFTEGQAVVLRKYLERNPDRLDELKALAASGQFEITAAGETVADTNLPAGETLLRNLTLGIRWFEEVFGVLPSIGWLEDAFGQSAQMPQLFRGCGVKHVLKVSYKHVPLPYWKGLDGSVVCIADAPVVHWAWGQGKIPPCPVCHGHGCGECEDYGLAANARSGFARRGFVTDESVRRTLDSDFSGDPCSVMTIGDEEAIPNLNLPELIAEANARLGAERFRWGTYADVARELAEVLDRVDDPGNGASGEVEANPVSTGCYVSRIRVKQVFRRLEHALVAAEKWATVAWLDGAAYPESDLLEAWRRVVFVAFHDAITSTHIDAAFDEIMQMLAEAESGIQRVLDGSLAYLERGLPAVPAPHRRLVVYNAESWDRRDPVTAVVPRGGGCPRLTAADGAAVEVLSWADRGDGCHVIFRPPAIPALGYAAFDLDYGDTAPPVEREGPGEIANDHYRIRAGRCGLESIVRIADGRELLDTRSHLGNELILEEDDGHPWGTQQPPAFAERLGRDTVSVRLIEEAGLARIVLTGRYQGRDGMVAHLEWQQETILYRGVDRIDFRTVIDWDTRSRRIKIAFPTPFRTSRAVWAIPYGALERGPYPPNLRTEAATDGSWPAINWVDIHDEERGMALLNRGLPAHTVEGGVIFLSVLRSPTRSWCLNEPEFYDCPDFDGARDAGRHVFEYALIPHEGSWQDAAIEKRGREYNTPLIARIPEAPGDGCRGPVHAFLRFEGSGNVVLTALKRADRIDGVVARLAETNGSHGEAAIRLEGADSRMEEVNFLEREARPAAMPLALDPFRIRTIQLPRSAST